MFLTGRVSSVETTAHRRWEGAGMKKYCAQEGGQGTGQAWAGITGVHPKLTQRCKSAVFHKRKNQEVYNCWLLKDHGITCLGQFNDF